MNPSKSDYVGVAIGIAFLVVFAGWLAMVFLAY